MEEYRHEWYRITKTVLQDYKTMVNDNEKEDDLTIYKKINRNIRCGIYLHDYKEFQVYGYGCLRLAVRDGNVVWIDNCRKPVPINRELKEKLDNVWGLNKLHIESNKN
jgi:hypothetical protein